MLEKWKDITETGLLRGAYQISSKGRIKMRTRTYYTGQYHSKRVIEGSFMKPSITAKNYSSGYYAQPLRLANGGQRTFFVHRLVAKYFLSNFTENLTVNHIDENTLNNDVSNLEMITMKDNVNYGTRTMRSTNTYVSNGNKHGVLKPVVVSKDGLEKSYRSISEASRELGISKVKINTVLKAERSQVHGYYIRYK